MTGSRKWTLGALAAGGLLIAALSGGTAFAQNTATTSPLAPPSQARAGQRNGGGVQDEYLAAALGITVEELEAAQAAAQSAAQADEVTSGEVSQEDATLMDARSALQEYLDEPMQAAYEAAVAAAAAAGVITQEQADVFLAQDWTEVGRGGFGGGRGGGPGAQGGQGDFGAPPEAPTGTDQAAPPQQP